MLYISEKVHDTRKKLNEMQLKVLSSPDVENIDEEKRLTAELQELLQAEEAFYKQKSRIDWTP